MSTDDLTKIGGVPIGEKRSIYFSTHGNSDPPRSDVIWIVCTYVKETLQPSIDHQHLRLVILGRNSSNSDQVVELTGGRSLQEMTKKIFVSVRECLLGK